MCGDKKIRKALHQVRKDLKVFSVNSQKLKWDTAKFRYKMRDISLWTFLLSFLAFALIPIKSNLLWAISFLKADAGAGIAVAGTGLGVGATATAITVNSILNSAHIIKQDTTIPIPEPKKKIEIVVEQKAVTPPKKHIPVFEPRKAKVIMVDSTTIECTIIDIQSDYLAVKDNDGVRTINQQDVYKIIW